MFYEGKNLVITPETKIGELLDNYPELEEKLISIAPVFAKLKNPILRKTIAKVTSIKQAAAVGGLNLYSMLNELRILAGQEKSEVSSGEILYELEMGQSIDADLIYDSRPDLEAGIPPVARVFNDLKNLRVNQVYKIITPFYPAPLISKAKDKGYSSETRQVSQDNYETYFRRIEE